MGKLYMVMQYWCFQNRAIYSRPKDFNTKFLSNFLLHQIQSSCRADKWYLTHFLKAVLWEIIFFPSPFFSQENSEQLAETSTVPTTLILLRTEFVRPPQGNWVQAISLPVSLLKDIICNMSAFKIPYLKLIRPFFCCVHTYLKCLQQCSNPDNNSFRSRLRCASHIGLPL